MEPFNLTILFPPLTSRRWSILFFVGLWALGLTPSLGQRIAERWALTPERPAKPLVHCAASPRAVCASAQVMCGDARVFAL